MRQVCALFLALVMVAAFAAIAPAAENMPTAQRSELITMKATIESVDPQNRMVTLRGPRGNLFTIKAGPDVANLPDLKPGDQIMARYYQSVAVQMAKPGEQPMMSSREMERSAVPGQPATAVERVTTTATVESIDKPNSMVTLKGSQGNMVTVKARNPDAIQKLKVGDQLNVTYTQAMAVSLEKGTG